MPIELQLLMNDVTDWAKKTFDAPITGPANHLVDEAKELTESLEKWRYTLVHGTMPESDAQEKEVHKEIADCFLLLIQVAKRAGLSADELLQVSRNKLVVNKTRKWGKLDERGVSQHIKE